MRQDEKQPPKKHPSDAIKKLSQAQLEQVLGGRYNANNDPVGDDGGGGGDFWADPARSAREIGPA